MNAHSSTENFRNWFPTKIYAAGGQGAVEWSCFENVRFTEPFFESTVLHRKRDSAQRPLVCTTPLGYLQDLTDHVADTAPTGFIFHVSRCGSTLVSQMLAAAAENIVLSEAPPVDFIVRGESGELADRAARIEYLKRIVAIYGRKRNPVEKHYFIKFDCWHTLDLALIREAFPAVPWIFLYRDPVEVIVSHGRRRGMQMMPGVIANLVPGALADLLQLPAEEYCARVLARIGESALEHAERAPARLINYSTLPEEFFVEALAHFGVEYDPATLGRMRAATARDAKTPQLDFVADAAAKRAEADASVIEAARKWAIPIYERLESARRHCGAIAGRKI